MLGIQKRLTNSFYAVLSLPATAMGFALSIQISALSWILSTKYNLRIDEVGFVWAAGPLAGILGQVIIGMISDKVWLWGGRRRPFILVGGVLAAIMLLALPNIHVIGAALGVKSLLIIATVVALTLDLAINVSFNPTRSVIADVTPEGNPRTKGYTWMQTISGFFGVLAYVVGAIFGNYTLIYSGVGIVLLFSILPTLFITEPMSVEADELPNSLNEINDVQPKVKTAQLFKIYFAHGFTWLGVQTMFIYIIAYIQQKLNPASETETGQIIAISFAILNTVGFILPAFVLEPMSEKIGRIKTHISCVAIMALGYFGIVAFGKSSIMLYILMAVLGIGWSAVVSLPFAIYSEKVNKNRMGFYMGIFNLSVVIPQLFASYGSGYLVQNMPDKNIIFIISGVSLTISALLWFLVKEEAKTVPKTKEFASQAH
ncbi:MAG TPA: MFS transporter [Ignavibacteriales bacterium]|nr:MFS transporter [Ignavibacteriales bacterium]